MLWNKFTLIRLKIGKKTEQDSFEVSRKVND